MSLTEKCHKSIKTRKFFKYVFRAISVRNVKVTMKYILHSKDYKHTVGSTFGDKPKHQTSIGTIQYHTIPKLFSKHFKNRRSRNKVLYTKIITRMLCLR